MRPTDEQYREAAFTKLEGVEHIDVGPAAKVFSGPGDDERGAWVTVQVWVTHDEATKAKP